MAISIFGGIGRIEWVLIAASQISKSKADFTTTDLIEQLVKGPKFDYDPQKWVNDLIQIACILELAEQKMKVKQYVYSVTPFGYAYLEALKLDPEKAREYLSMTIVKKPWVREALLYIATHKPVVQADIVKALENFREGFDCVSIQVALKIAEDLRLIEIDKERPKTFRISPLGKNIYGERLLCHKTNVMQE